MVKQETRELSKKMLPQPRLKGRGEKNELPELEAVGLGKSDGIRNPKPRVQLLIDSKRDRNASTSLFSHPPVSFH